MKYSELTVAELKALEAELKELYQETAKKSLTSTLPAASLRKNS